MVDDERTPQDDPFTRRQALDRGRTPAEIRWALRTGRWLTLRRGVYCRRHTFEGADSDGRHLCTRVQPYSRMTNDTS